MLLGGFWAARARLQGPVAVPLSRPANIGIYNSFSRERKPKHRYQPCPPSATEDFVHRGLLLHRYNQMPSLDEKLATSLFGHMEHAKSVPWSASGGGQVPKPTTIIGQFPFLKLTPELRIFIYRLLYQRKSQIWFTGHRAHHLGADKIDTGLLLSCREIYHEASAVLYDTNIFSVNGRADPGEILGRLEMQACSYMKRLRIWSIPLEFFELEREQACPKALVPSVPMYRSVWACVSHHLQNLETIELGIFGSDFFAAISRCTSSIRLADKNRPPPLIEIEVGEAAIASTRPPGSRRGRFHVATRERNKALWLPAVKSIRLVGRLNKSDCKYLQRAAFHHYNIRSVEKLDVKDLHTAYRHTSGVLISLKMRPQSVRHALVFHETDGLQQDERFDAGDADGSEMSEADILYLFQESGLAMLELDRNDGATFGAGAKD